jgi:hypothetical protein
VRRRVQVSLVLVGWCILGMGLIANIFALRASATTSAACIELLQDGGFEAGGQGWLRYSAQGYELISDFNARSGSQGAYLAGVNNADDHLSQQVNLPIGTSILRAWWYLATAETAGAFDQMTVSLLNSEGSWLTDLVTVDNTAEVGVWDEILVDLSPYAGQTIVLRFAGRTDGTNISDFYLDDISISACDSAPQPTSTATSTPKPPAATATASATSPRTAPTSTTTASPPAVTATAPPTSERSLPCGYLPYVIR